MSIVNLQGYFQEVDNKNRIIFKCNEESFDKLSAIVDSYTNIQFHPILTGKLCKIHQHNHIKIDVQKYTDGVLYDIKVKFVKRKNILTLKIMEFTPPNY